MLKLPKDVLTHPATAQLEAFLRSRERPLRDGSPVPVTELELDPKLAFALNAARGTGHLVQGLELIDDKLRREEKGLAALRAKTGQAQGQRLSRLILLAADGSERFYHDVESVLTKHADRAWAFRLDAKSDALGAYTPKGNPTKALMIDDRKALVLFLRAYAEELAR